ncbi:hypothetical protein H4W33_004307 [Kibdelosporangium phytohabitans]|uniref:Chaplin domain-containing protein n=1 Tax=Kibdelosporangium phytohabitans TaxID=860235 RepID=A0A0N9I5T2_9PSEU|nr:hypothetical protein AOZ06_47220 [Kibdelosporangium phytohabitans]MBE1465295.1 hypothetical protein [Kibdelosporangium phytohabitans]
MARIKTSVAAVAAYGFVVLAALVSGAPESVDHPRDIRSVSTADACDQGGLTPESRHHIRCGSEIVLASRHHI